MPWRGQPSSRCSDILRVRRRRFSLLASLEDFFGPGAEGGGMAFDDSTELGPVDRVFTFSPQWLGGATDDTPVMLANEWAVPVVVAGDPVGVAIVWINPTTVRPQLADFSPVPEFAAALPDVPAAAYLVHDSCPAPRESPAPPASTCTAGRSRPARRPRRRRRWASARRSRSE